MNGAFGSRDGRQLFHTVQLSLERTSLIHGHTPYVTVSYDDVRLVKAPEVPRRVPAMSNSQAAAKQFQSSHSTPRVNTSERPPVDESSERLVDSDHQPSNHY